jgi:hypothetical protein
MCHRLMGLKLQSERVQRDAYVRMKEIAIFGNIRKYIVSLFGPDVLENVISPSILDTVLKAY